MYLNCPQSVYFEITNVCNSLCLLFIILVVLLPLFVLLIQYSDSKSIPSIPRILLNPESNKVKVFPRDEVLPPFFLDYREGPPYLTRWDWTEGPPSPSRLAELQNLYDGSHQGSTPQILHELGKFIQCQ